MNINPIFNSTPTQSHAARPKTKAPPKPIAGVSSDPCPANAVELVAEAAALSLLAAVALIEPDVIVESVVEVATHAAVMRFVCDAKELSSSLRLAELVSVASTDVMEL